MQSRVPVLNFQTTKTDIARPIFSFEGRETKKRNTYNLGIYLDWEKEALAAGSEL